MVGTFYHQIYLRVLVGLLTAPCTGIIEDSVNAQCLFKLIQMKKAQEFKAKALPTSKLDKFIHKAFSLNNLPKVQKIFGFGKLSVESMRENTAQKGSLQT